MKEEEVKEYLVAYRDNCSDFYCIKFLYDEGHLRGCVIKDTSQFKKFYRGVVFSNNKDYLASLKKNNFGSFSLRRSLAETFAMEIRDDDVDNVLIIVNPSDCEVIIDMRKAFAKYGIIDEGCLFSMESEQEYYIIYNKFDYDLLNNNLREMKLFP